jgi:hypothetical protein
MSGGFGAGLEFLLDAGGSPGGSWLSDIFGGGIGPQGTASLLGAGIGALGNIFGAQTVSSGQDRALQAQLAAQEAARREMLARSDRGLADIDAGLAAYRKTVEPLLTPRPIVMNQHRGMTDQQRIGLEDLRRSGLASISASGLRGAGRAGVGALMDQERRYRAAAAAGNDTDTRNEKRRAQGVADDVTQGLASAELQTGGAKANTNIMVGNNLASSHQAGGNAAASAATTTANTNANSTMANARLFGSAVGDLGAIYANDQRRNSAGSGVWGT